MKTFLQPFSRLFAFGSKRLLMKDKPELEDISYLLSSSNRMEGEPVVRDLYELAKAFRERILGLELDPDSDVDPDTEPDSWALQTMMNLLGEEGFAELKYPDPLEYFFSSADENGDLLELQSEEGDEEYVLGKFLGQGSFGEVFEAEDQYGNEVVVKLITPKGDHIAESALKSPPSDLSTSEHDEMWAEYEEERVRLSKEQYLLMKVMAEARGLAYVEHDHMVLPVGIGEYEGGYFIALEYCRNGDAMQNRKILRALPKAELNRNILGMAHALQDLHDRGVIHGDLKPHNVLIGDEYTVDGEKRRDWKISDFGLARLMSDRPEHGRIGTQNYMDPEHDATGSEKKAVLKPTMDWYSFAATIVRILTDKIYKKEDPDEVRQLLEEKLDPLIVDILISLLQERSADRLEPESVVERLENALEVIAFRQHRDQEKASRAA